MLCVRTSIRIEIAAKKENVTSERGEERGNKKKKSREELKKARHIMKWVQQLKSCYLWACAGIWDWFPEAVEHAQREREREKELNKSDYFLFVRFVAFQFHSLCDSCRFAGDFAATATMTASERTSKGSEKICISLCVCCRLCVFDSVEFVRDLHRGGRRERKSGAWRRLR